MSVGLGLGPLDHDALPGGQPLLLSPGVDASVGVTAQVIAARGSFLVAQLPVLIPDRFIDPDHAAGRPLRRHVDSVADGLLPTHPTTRIWLASVLTVPTHLGVVSKHAERPASEESGSPKGLVPCAQISQPDPVKEAA